MNWINLSGLTSFDKSMKLMINAVNNNNYSVFLLEYDDIYTSGRDCVKNDIVDHNINIIQTNRGGKLTYHGKGQRIIYPIMLLKERNIRLYIIKLENWIIKTLSDFGVVAFSKKGEVGIWVKEGFNEAKIGFIGIAVKRWIAYHGISININTDLTKFDKIIPCGLTNAKITSLHRMGVKISFVEFDEALKKNYYNIFVNN